MRARVRERVSFHVRFRARVKVRGRVRVTVRIGVMLTVGVRVTSTCGYLDVRGVDGSPQCHSREATP